MPVFLIEIIASLLSLLGAGAALNSAPVQQLIRKILRAEERHAKESYRGKLDQLLASLSKASEEVEAVLMELGQVAKERQEAVQKLENDLRALKTRENELQEVIQTLEKVPIPVAKYLADAASAGERRSARRDYILFGLGVVVSTIVTIILRALGLG